MRHCGTRLLNLLLIGMFAGEVSIYNTHQHQNCDYNNTGNAFPFILAHQPNQNCHQGEYKYGKENDGWSAQDNY